MPASHKRIPSYRLHKASGQAVVTLQGTDIYLGKFDSKVSRIEYTRVISEWEANNRIIPPVKPDDDPTVNMILDAFWKHAVVYYRNQDGTPSRGCINFKPPLKYVTELYGNTLARNFGPLALKAVREAMLDYKWSRLTINKQINRVRHVFKWAVSMELIPPSVFESLRSVDGLKRGRTIARESEGVKPVPQAYVDAIKDYVSRQVWAMIQIQLLTGARPGEIVKMRAIDIDTTGKIWLYQPQDHKTSYRGHKRTIYLGPKAQEIVRHFISNRSLDSYLFSPIEAERERRDLLHTQRKTPMSCGNRPGSNRKKLPQHQPRERYHVSSYGRAISRGCDSAFPHPVLSNIHPRKMTSAQREELKTWQKDHRWSPNQLRHTRATELRRKFGIDVARIILGHRSAQVTEIYAELDYVKAEEIMAKVG